MTDKFSRDLLNVLGRIARALERIAYQLKISDEEDNDNDDSED